MLLGIHIKNFDVFDDDRCGILMEDSIGLAGDSEASYKALRLKNLNALIGRNQTGKTSFLMAMSFIKRCILTDVGEASRIDGRQGFVNLIQDRTKPAEFKLFFKLKDKDAGEHKSKYIQYELTLEANQFGSPVVKSEIIKMSVGSAIGIKIVNLLEMNYGEGKIYTPANVYNSEETNITNEHQTALSVYGQIGMYKHIADLYREIYRWFFCSFSSEITNSYYMDGGAPGGHKHLNSSGSNVMNVIEYMSQTNPDMCDRIIDNIQSKIPAMRGKKTTPVNFENSPDKLFMYLLLLADTDPHSTIFIEAPDKDLYHDMVDVLSVEMRDFTIKNPYSQIVFTTHNPYIVESMSPKEIWVFTRDFGSEIDDGVNIKCAASDPLVENMFKEGVGMGAIWYGGHLDGSGSNGGSN